MTNITSGTLRPRRQHTVTSKSHFDAQGIALHHGAFIRDAAMHSSFVEVGRNSCIHARSGGANITDCLLFQSSFCLFHSTIVTTAHESHIIHDGTLWSTSEYIVTRLVRMAIMHNVGTINEAYSLPSSSHLRCRDYTFFSRTAFLLHAIVLPMLHQNRFHTIFTTYLSSLLYESPSYASSHPSTTSFSPVHSARSKVAQNLI